MKRLSLWFRNFMMGRYGSDKLNMWILGFGVICCISGLFLTWLPVVYLVLSILSYVLMFLAIKLLSGTNSLITQDSL